MESRSPKRTFSRREFLAISGVSTAAFALGCGGSGSGNALPLPGAIEVVVIGAGVAGLAAGRALKEAGRSFVILEARERPGGRVHSNNSFPVPFDYGAQLFQQVVPIGDNPKHTTNPLFNIAVEQHAQINPALVNSIPMRGKDPLSLEEALEMGAVLELMHSSAVQAGKAAAMAGAGDISLQAAVAGLAGSPFFDANYVFLEADRGVSGDQISCQELYGYSTLTTATFGEPSTDNWFCKTGMGNFIAQFANGLPIQYSTPAISIDHHGSGVRVTTAGGTIDAQAVIVTSSMGVLASGRPGFNPGLPAEYTEAFQSLRMGSVAKVGYEFSVDVFGGLTDTTILSPLPPDGTDDFAAMFAKFYGQNMMYVLLGGPSCREAEAGGREGLMAFADAAVARTLGEEVLAPGVLVQRDCHSWLNDEWAMGAWSVAPPGDVSMRVKLQTPIEGKIFFAGEAVSVESAASMAGAWETGRMAVQNYVAHAA